VVDALQALRGAAKVTAVTLATEFGSFKRFARAAGLAVAEGREHCG
jgi:hypothetical protein